MADWQWNGFQVNMLSSQSVRFMFKVADFIEKDVLAEGETASPLLNLPDWTHSICLHFFKNAL